MPTKVAPSGTGAVPVLVSGPEMAAYALPSRSQNTRPQHTAATEVISATCSLVQVHTVSTHGESDARVSNRSPTGEGYVPFAAGIPLLEAVLGLIPRAGHPLVLVRDNSSAWSVCFLDPAARTLCPGFPSFRCDRRDSVWETPVEKPAAAHASLIPSLTAIRRTPMRAAVHDQVSVAVARIAPTERDAAQVTVAAFNSAV
jgi:hypothetical protein